MKRGPVESIPMVLPPEATSFDADAFDELLRAHGVQAQHFRAMRCPVGMTDPDDVMRRPHEHHENCSNSFIYTLAGELHISFAGNGREANFSDYGRMDGSTVQATMTRFYDDKPDKRVSMCQFDRIYLKEESITVEDWHTYARGETDSDKLQFPAVAVSDLVDSHDKRYTPGIDFDVRGGRIHWLTAGPAPGTVMSVRYVYRPFWYVERMIHEVRVAQIEDEWGNRSLQRMPQQAQLKREVWFEKEQRDAEVKDTGRQKTPPPSTFGPR
jgi:hypothetical protein